jgi:hypothetical protein
MADIAEEDPTDASGLVRWITLQIASWQNRLDEPTGDSGALHLPIADGAKVGRVAKVTLHAPSPAYLCAEKFRDLVIKLCSTSVALKFGERFPYRPGLKVRDMIVAMRWVAELIASPESSSLAGAQSEADASQASRDREDGICDGDSAASLATDATGARSKTKSIELRQFDGGQLVFFQDRVELCGVDICSGPRCRTKRRILDLLRKKRSDGTFVSYSGGRLAKKLGGQCAAGTVIGAIRDLRTDIVEALRDKANILCERQDVILSGRPGYRFANRITVQDDCQPEAAQIADTIDEGDVRDVGDVGVRNVPDVLNECDDAAEMRRQWILKRLAEGEQLKAPAVAAPFKCSRKTAERDFAALKKEENIEFVGATRTGYYRLRHAPRRKSRVRRKVPKPGSRQRIRR